MLDLLPGSARSLRTAERLRPLLRVKGTLVRHLEVDLPDPPDEAGLRDGLAPPVKGGGPPPTVWLAQLVRAATLATWTDLTGRSVPATRLTPRWTMPSPPATTRQSTVRAAMAARARSVAWTPSMAERSTTS